MRVNKKHNIDLLFSDNELKSDLILLMVLIKGKPEYSFKSSAIKEIKYKVRFRVK